MKIWKVAEDFLDDTIEELDLNLTGAHNIGPLYRGISGHEDSSVNSYYFDDAVFYTKNESYAKKYDKGGGVSVAMGKSNNPLVLESGDNVVERLPISFWNKLSRIEQEDMRSYANAYSSTWPSQKSLISYAKKYGYDAICTEEAGETWIFFSPDQIKELS